MKKTIKKFLFVMLAMISAFSVVGTSACTKPSEESVETIPNIVGFQGTHIYTSPETSQYVVQNGVCDYMLVVPATSSSWIVTAKTEFQYLFKMATGIDIASTTDDKIPTSSHSANTKYISLGNTSLIQSTDIDYSEEKLGRDGVRIVTKDNNIYVVGGTDVGTIYAVYTFMRLTFNYESYTTNTITIDKNVRNLKLKKYDVTDIPDFAERTPGATTVLGEARYTEYDAKMFMNRMGYMSGNTQLAYRSHAVRPADNEQGFEVRDDIMAIGHPADTILNRAAWYDLHKEWYSDIGNQWCYTAHGNEESLDLMTDMVVESIKYSLKTYKYSRPYAYAYNMGQNDNDDWCGCQACGELMDKYNTVSGSVIRFANIVGKKIEAWMNLPENAEWKNDNLEITIHAYMGTDTPPVKYNDAKKKWEPIDETVIPYKNISITHALIYTDHQQSYFSEFNKYFKDKTDGWAALTDNIHWYSYDYFAHQPLYLHDSFSFYTSENFQYRASISRNAMYVESLGGGSNLSAWYNLKVFLIARLSWNSSLNEQELIKDYFDAVYGSASQDMRRLFNAVRMYTYDQEEKNGLFKRHSIFAEIQKCDWKLNAINSWLEIIDQAYESIEVYKSRDPKLYETYSYNIELEALSPIYIKLSQHMEYLSLTEKKSLITRLKNDFSHWPDMKGIHYMQNALLGDYLNSIDTVA